MYKVTFSSLLVSLAVMATSAAEANVPVKSLSSTANKKSFHRGIMLGICVDQALTAKGITLKLPVAGQAYALDDSTKTAVASAVTQCRATLSGVSASTTTASAVVPAATPVAATTATPAASDSSTTETASGQTTL